MNRRPALNHSRELGSADGPIVQGRGIEVGSVRPDQRVRLGVDGHLVEELKVAERAIHFTAENGQKIDQMTRCHYFSGSIACGSLPEWRSSQSASSAPLYLGKTRAGLP